MASRSFPSSSRVMPALSAEDIVAEARWRMSSSLLFSEPVSFALEAIDPGTDVSVLNSPDTLEMRSTVPPRLSKSSPELRRTTDTSVMNFFLAPPLNRSLPLESCQFLRMS